MTNESHRIWYDTYIDAVIHYIRNYALADHAYMGNGSVPYFPSCSWRCRFFIYAISNGATCGNRYNPKRIVSSAQPSASGDWGGWVNSGRACLRIPKWPNY